jgi:hypothetical protein
MTVAMPSWPSQLKAVGGNAEGSLDRRAGIVPADDRCDALLAIPSTPIAGIV